MRILMITPYLPYPLVSGGQIRTYNLLKNLSKKHDITLVSFIRNPTEKKYLANLEKYCKGVHLVLRRPAWSWKNILTATVSYFPFLIAIYFSFQAKKIISKLLAEQKFDLIHAETFYVMPNIPKTSVPILLVEQTIEYLVYDHFVKSVPFLLRPVLSWDVLKIKFWEKNYWKKSAQVVATSKIDADIMNGLVPKLGVKIIPNGVDIDFFSKKLNVKPKNQTILFVGNFKWLQNREAVQFLAKKIFPKILTENPNAKLWIVGKNPTPEIKRLKSSNTLIDDGIDDIRLAYQSSSVMLAPIFGPGGTRYKILEAMASNLPVVTTPRGIEGIPVEVGSEILTGKNSSKLAKLTVGLLKDRKKAESISQKAKLLVEKEFNWNKISQQLDALYQRVSKTQKVNHG